jgi:hypothetical protein
MSVPNSKKKWKQITCPTCHREFGVRRGRFPAQCLYEDCLAMLPRATVVRREEPDDSAAEQMIQDTLDNY